MIHGWSIGKLNLLKWSIDSSLDGQLGNNLLFTRGDVIYVDGCAILHHQNDGWTPIDHGILPIYQLVIRISQPPSTVRSPMFHSITMVKWLLNLYIYINTYMHILAMIRSSMFNKWPIDPPNRFSRPSLQVRFDPHSSGEMTREDRRWISAFQKLGDVIENGHL